MADIASAPQSIDNATVILWVVGVLFTALAGVVAALWRQMCLNNKECREDNRLVREDADDVRKKHDQLYESIVEHASERERRLTEVVERNTAAMTELKDAVSSGYWKAIRRIEGKDT